MTWLRPRSSRFRLSSFCFAIINAWLPSYGLTRLLELQPLQLYSRKSEGGRKEEKGLISPLEVLFD